MNFFDHVPQESTEGFPQSYFEKSLDTEDQTLPSFLDFLKKRGLDPDMYDNLAWQIMQLNCEFVSYHALCKALLEQQRLAKEQAIRSGDFEAQVKDMSVHDLMATNAAFEARQARIQQEIDRKSRESKADQAVSGK